MALTRILAVLALTVPSPSSAHFESNSISDNEETTSHAQHFRQETRHFAIDQIRNKYMPSALASTQLDTTAPILDDSARIVGGSEVTAGAYPYFVRVDNNGQFWCGGTLVAPDIVLTAGHCFSDYLSVTINGYTAPNVANEGQQLRFVEYLSRHPDYDGVTYSNDAMLLKLDSSADSIVPIRLNADNANPQTGDNLIVMGLGATAEGGGYPDYLLEVTIQAVDFATCASAYASASTMIINETVALCAGVPGGQKDACQGDSGGPLIDASGAQVGIVSSGIGCARPEFPGIYARVSGLIEWIESSICSMSDDKPTWCDPIITQLPTIAPMSPAPSTITPTSLAPTTLVPTTSMPSLAPTTLAPTTLAPTTSMPTIAPTTLDPTAIPTPIPTTLAPTTLTPSIAPTTLDPTMIPTLLPTTLAPTTLMPTIAPTTRDPTTMPTPAPSTLAPTTATLTPSTSMPTMTPIVQPVLSPTGSPTISMMPVPTQIPTPIPSNLLTTISPTSAPFIEVPTALAGGNGPETNFPSVTPADCRDIANQSFPVGDFDGTQDCAWLFSAPESIQIALCRPDKPAWNICERTCRKCGDNCLDLEMVLFMVEGEYQDCSWLRSKTRLQRELCSKGHDAHEVCRETCQSCVQEGGVLDDKLNSTSIPVQRDPYEELRESFLRPRTRARDEDKPRHTGMSVGSGDENESDRNNDRQ